MTDDLITIEKLRELRDRIAVDVAAGNVGTVGFLNTEFEWKSATYVRQLLAQPAGSGGVVTCAMCDAQMEKAFGPVVYPIAAAPASPQGSVPCGWLVTHAEGLSYCAAKLDADRQAQEWKDAGHVAIQISRMYTPPSSGDGRGVDRGE